MANGRGRGEPVTSWRKLAGSMWKAPADPQFMGSMDLDAGAVLAFCEEATEASGVRVTITHAVGRAIAHALVEVPELAQRLAFGRQYPRESIDVFFIITTDNGHDLTGVKIERTDKKSAVEVAKELLGRRGQIATGEDKHFGRTKRMLEVLPAPILRRAIQLSAWLTSDLNLDLPNLGLPRQAFGSAMVTSVGMWGVTSAFSPLAAAYRVPVLVLIGAVEDRPVAAAGLVTVRPMITLTATFDHRYVDGFQAARFGAAMREYLAHPQKFEPDFA